MSDRGFNERSVTEIWWWVFRVQFFDQVHLINIKKSDLHLFIRPTSSFPSHFLISFSWYLHYLITLYHLFPPLFFPFSHPLFLFRLLSLYHSVHISFCRSILLGCFTGTGVEMSITECNWMEIVPWARIPSLTQIFATAPSMPYINRGSRVPRGGLEWNGSMCLLTLRDLTLMLHHHQSLPPKGVDKGTDGMGCIGWGCVWRRPWPTWISRVNR